MQLTTLDRAPLGALLTLVNVDVDAGVRRRLVSLGLRRGVQLRLVQRLAGGAHLVSVAGARVALGRSVLAALTVELAAR